MKNESECVSSDSFCCIVSVCVLADVYMISLTDLYSGCRCVRLDFWGNRRQKPFETVSRCSVTSHKSIIRPDGNSEDS